MSESTCGQPGEDDNYCFVVEWYDPSASLVRRYSFYYFEKDGTIEMYDPKYHRLFLRRCKVDNVRVSDLFIGSIINVMSRQLKIVEYGNDCTRRRLGQIKERAFAMIKPDGYCKMGQILESIHRCGLQVTKMRTSSLDRSDVTELFADERHNGKYPELLTYLSSGQILVMELMGENAIERWLSLMGPEDPVIARKCAPMSIRARYGCDLMKNVCLSSDTPAGTARFLEFFFPSTGLPRPNTAVFSDTTCCIIKPHAVLSGCVGPIISKIIECCFEVTCVAQFYIEKANAEEFYEVYKGVVQEYPSMVIELCSGPSVVLEIRAEDAVKAFREFTGPADPEIARHLRPRTLRAQFGKTKAQNAVHCTDLPEDGQLETEYFFKILDR